VYPDSHVALQEADAYPARPETEYGWEKLFSERLCACFTKEGKVETRVARYFTLYGQGDNKGDHGHVVEALCRKVMAAPDGGEVEVWGDGLQTRSLLFIDDCIEGTLRVMRGDFSSPVNLSSPWSFSINAILSVIAQCSGKTVVARHNLSGVQGVRDRHSDNSLVLKRYGWEPSTRLYDGISRTYDWLTNSC
jgi:GDP-D-mannose 3', 5'-epimerase